MDPLIAGFLVYSGLKAADGALGEIGNDLYSYIKRKFKPLAQKIDYARKFPQKADLNLLSEELEDKTKKDDELKKIISSLVQELRKRKARMDNRKIIYNNKVNAQRDIHLGSVTKIRQQIRNISNFGSGDIILGDKNSGKENVKKNGY